jgi:MFS family permease
MAQKVHQVIDKPAIPFAVRWGVLVLVSLSMFGNYYVYDSIAPVADLLAKQLKFTDGDIGLLQGIYSIPNILMVLIGGIIIDKIGTVKSITIFSILCFLGAIVTVMTDQLAFIGELFRSVFNSTASNELVVMCLGRLIFGLGAESLIVAVTTVLGKWFIGKELSFAFGINLTIARLGSFAADNSPTWAKAYFTSWELPLYIAVIMAFISIVTALAYWYLDSYAKTNYHMKPEAKQEKFVFKELFNFSNSYWFIVLLCVTFYSGMFPFRTFAIKFFQDYHGLDREIGGMYSSILILSSMILTPLFGLLSDFIGKRSLLMMCGSIIMIPVYIMLLQTGIPPWLPMAMMGVSFSLIPAVMWPSVALIAPEAKLGTAYGFMTMIQNIGLAGFNILIGSVNDYTGTYEVGMYLFSTLGFFGLFFAFMLRRAESKATGHGLEFGMMHKK